MNLVAKEYIATRTDKTGVLILSEMAGSANEMNEALLINPNNFEQQADTLKKAIEMPKEQQMARNIFLQNRLKRYTVETWATEFLSVLNSKNEGVTDFTSQRIDKSIIENIVQKYQSAKKTAVL